MTVQSYTYAKRWRHERAQGLMRTTDSAAVVDRIRALEAEGWSLRSIADAAGLSVQCVSRLSRGVQDRVINETARKLLAVDGDAIRARPNRGGFVVKVGAVRRIQALLALGHRHEDITAAMRAAKPDLGTTSQLVMHQVGRWTTRGTHDAVCHAYDALSMQPGGSGRTRARALKLGYVPPLGWDDDALDDPYGEPLSDVDDQVALDEIALERLMTGQLRVDVHGNTPELVEAVRRLAEQGLADGQIGARVGLSNSGVQHLRRRHTIPTSVPAGRTA